MVQDTRAVFTFVAWRCLCGSKLVDSTMADRAAGALRWGDEERRLAQKHLQDGKLDPTRIRSASHLRSIQRLETVWARHPSKNFCQNVRRQTTQWVADQERDGGRRGGGQAPAAVEEEEEEEVDEAEEDDFFPGGGGEGDEADDRECLCVRHFFLFFLTGNSFLPQNLLQQKFLVLVRSKGATANALPLVKIAV